MSLFNHPHGFTQQNFKLFKLTSYLGKRPIQVFTCVLVCLTLATSQVPQGASLTSVATYHNDPQRTGWNPQEYTLTPATVKSPNFGFYTSVALDDRIDAQPLVVPTPPLVNRGPEAGINLPVRPSELVYVATEGNTVYAINPGAPTSPVGTPAQIANKRNLGAPVPLPLSCGDSGGNVGINSTPTIDVSTRTMYVIAYTSIGGKPTYQLHALDLDSLNDRPGSPATVAASHTLANGSKISFDASVQRQRPGLLLADGNVYAGFGSFCDYTSTARGWLLGWNAASLKPLASNEVVDTANTPSSYAACGNTQTCHLAAIWMSGYGIAAETPGDIFFVTGNGGDVYNSTTSLQESVVKVAPDLASVHHTFTPTNFADLDKEDTDFGSGGVMVVPDQPGPKPKLAVAAGKDGRLFILDRSNLGGLSNQPNVTIGACWCGPSYFKGADGVGRVVSSGGTQAKTWKINTSAATALQMEAAAPAVNLGAHNGGFFTSISSNGTVANTAIIWALGRPVANNGNQVWLYAFDATQSGGKLPLLWSAPAGDRPSSDTGNTFLVPTVANGKVYVASYKSLKIAGLSSRPLVTVPDLFEDSPTEATKELAALGLVAKLGGSGTWVGSQSPVAGSIVSEGTTVTLTLRSGIKPVAAVDAKQMSARISGAPASPAESPEIDGSLYWGTIQKVQGSLLSVQLRTGKLLNADLSQALKAGTTVNPTVGLSVRLMGPVSSKGVMDVRSMSRAKAPGSWGADRP